MQEIQERERGQICRYLYRGTTFSRLVDRLAENLTIGSSRPLVSFCRVVYGASGTLVFGR